MAVSILRSLTYDYSPVSQPSTMSTHSHKLLTSTVTYSSAAHTEITGFLYCISCPLCANWKYSYASKFHQFLPKWCMHFAFIDHERLRQFKWVREVSWRINRDQNKSIFVQSVLWAAIASFLLEHLEISGITQVSATKETSLPLVQSFSITFLTCACMPLQLSRSSWGLSSSCNPSKYTDGWSLFLSPSSVSTTSNWVYSALSLKLLLAIQYNIFLQFSVIFSPISLTHVPVAVRGLASGLTSGGQCITSFTMNVSQEGNNSWEQ